jgi:hypothetical protein
VLYLSPTPVTPIETLSTGLYKAFPKFHDALYGFPVFHMTIALGYPQQEQEAIVTEYFERFGKAPLKLRAGSLCMCVQQGEKWMGYRSFPLSGTN